MVNPFRNQKKEPEIKNQKQDLLTSPILSGQSSNQKIPKPDLSDVKTKEEREEEKEVKTGRGRSKKKDSELKESIKFIPLMVNGICKISKVEELGKLETEWLSSSSYAMLRKYEVGWIEEISFGLCLLEITTTRIMEKYFQKKLSYEKQKMDYEEKRKESRFETAREESAE